MRYTRPIRRLAAVAALLALPAVALPGPVGASPLGASPLAPNAAPPNPPVWPVPDLVADVRNLLVQYYNQEPAVPPAIDNYYALAPERETDKAPSKKDPDMIWEYDLDTSTACHAALSDDDFIRCTGYRLAKTLGLSYSGGLTLFDASRGFYANQGIADMAGYYALYHAFAHDYDAPNATYVRSTGRDARDGKSYHARMIAAYEAHMRDILMKMFRDTRTNTPSNTQFQADLTRSAGLTELNYVRVVEAMQEYNAWRQPMDRRNAINLVNGLNQRIWWEWVWTQSSGPRTAGFADLGSEATFQAALAGNPGYAGANQFIYDGAPISSLRPAAMDTGSTAGLWFDADYALPGEWWCYARFSGTDRDACIADARRQSKDGSKSPFGQYYGPTTPSPDCAARAGSATSLTCADTNMGSIAEEWTWTFTGARAGMFLVKTLYDHNDADRPAGPIGRTEYQVTTDRLGYGISGFHGGYGYHDDLEWTWNQPSGSPQAIRTLSAGRHDYEMQDGRWSLGETDTSSVSSARKGDTWNSVSERQEFPGAIENHLPGPNTVYGALLFWLTLSDRTSTGLSGSYYDNTHRNHPDEFNSWVWLLESTFYRCPGVSDPADPSCFAFNTSSWPNPAVVNRKPLFLRPDDTTALRFRYLWRDTYNALDAGYIATPDTACRGGSGLPWRRLYRPDAVSLHMLDESGYGAYGELIPGMGAAMRVLAARYAVETDAVQKSQVQQAWYNEAYTLVKGILGLYKTDYGYVPDIENSTCAGFESDGSGLGIVSWQQGTGDSVTTTIVRRAMFYSTAALWYSWYDTNWLDVDAGRW